MYSVITTHELTTSELERAPKGLKRSSIEVHYSRKRDATEAFEYEQYFRSRLGFTDSIQLVNRKTGQVINQA